MKKLKHVEFLSYDQLVKNLQRKNLIISDRQLAIELLKARGYYNLINRYKDHVYNHDKKYPNHTHLTDLFLFQTMEADFQDILFQATINFEHRFKETIAHNLSTRLGIVEADYLDPLKYKKRKFNKCISIMAFLLGIIYHTDKYPTKYYRENYDCIPPWILLNNVTLGQVRMWFSVFNTDMTIDVISEMLPIETNPFDKFKNASISTYALRRIEAEGHHDIFGIFHEQNDEEIKVINKEYQNNLNDIINLFKNMLSIIHDFRNNLAHGDGLFDFNSKSTLLLSPLRFFASPDVITNKEFNHQFGKNDLFAFMISLVITLDKYDAVNLLKHLSDWENNNSSTTKRANSLHLFLQGLNLPTNFISRLEHINREMTQEEYRYKVF